jgi:dienelactone hydrolase
MSKIVFETSRAGDIPLLTAYPADARPCPVVFFLHGMTGRKEDGVALAYRLASAGILAVCPDAPMHGERLSPRVADPGAPFPGDAFRDAVYPPETGLDFWLLMIEVAAQAAAEMTTLLEGRFAADPRADTTRLGVTGLSMGGYFAHYAAAHVPAVCAAVSGIGMPAFAARWQDVTLEAASYAKWADPMAAAQPEIARRLAWLRQIDPFDRLPAFAPRPLLMLCGDEDTAQPKSYSVALYRSLLPRYAEHPDCLHLSIYDGVGHDFTPGMMDETTAWFARWL